jgi:hypothetical protein
MSRSLRFAAYGWVLLSGLVLAGCVSAGSPLKSGEKVRVLERIAKGACAVRSSFAVAAASRDRERGAETSRAIWREEELAAGTGCGRAGMGLSFQRSPKG